MSTLTKRLVMLAAGLLVFGAASVTASAAPRRIVVVPHVRFGFHRTWAYDPFFGPYPYGYGYGYGYAYPVPVDRSAAIRTDVTPKQAEVFVDGYFAGHVGDFDGAFSHLNVLPGGHQVTFHLDGFRTMTQDVYVRPDSTFKMDATMERLGRGETSAPVPLPAPAPTD